MSNPARRWSALAAGLAMIAGSPGCAGIRLGERPAWAEPDPTAPAGPTARASSVGAELRAFPSETPWPARRSTALASASASRPAPVDGSIRRSGDLPSTSISPLSGPGEPIASSPLESSIPPGPSTLPIDLPSALRLADSANPAIGEARARVGIALGQQLQARVILLPNLNAGASYDGHAGVLQQSFGRILNVDRQAVYFGGGTYATAQNPVAIPAVNINAHLGDALYNPLAARQQLDSVKFDAEATANSVLLGVAVEYLELQAAGSERLARQRTEIEAAEVARITATYARSGEGRRADANRAETQLQLRRAEVRKADERVAVASARLARRLHLDPSATIEPSNAEPELFPLVEPDADLEGMIRTAMDRRPEVQARSSLVGAASTRVRQEKVRPLYPQLFLGYSAGGFGGGSNRATPLVGNFGPRQDFDAVAYWSLLNLGAGNLAQIRRRQAQLGEAEAQKEQAINQVREEVASARADVLARRDTLRIAVEELNVAQDGYHKDLEAIKQAASPPLEVLNNLNLLQKARSALIDAVLGYNQAQFRLFVAMGSPPPLDLPTEPAAPARSIDILAGRDRPAPSVVASGDDRGAPAIDAPSPFAGRGGVEALDRAARKVAEASGDYERKQADLFRSATSGGASRSKDDWARELSGLAESHREEQSAKLAYDKALWDLLGGNVARGGGPPPARVAGPGPADAPDLSGPR